jgi:hypothetical protein
MTHRQKGNDMATKLTDSELASILKTHRRIAVVGLSPVPARPSYGVTRYMIDHGYEIYGVRPASPKEILGRPAVESLQELPGPVDIIDVFRNSDAIPELVADLETWIKTLPEDKRPKVLWLQEGITHPEAERRAEEIGLKVIADRCILKEHARLV